ncbi:MAG: tRNA (adenosine(37)-N6)-threonylcarbamoyltransferase complex dimerization subunit type 1 TsaB [Chlamydiales bacterium]|nr:tRNA (adenosine(37)-N6)-threonylcarbamoyltransferase complex dimerization subunit type 1 TsaB [Chlamydiales bacterium]
MNTDSLLRLIIDTSSEKSLLAFCRGDTILSFLIRPHANQLSKELIPSLQSLALEAGIDWKSIEEIAVGIGPGSYTGTRVGVAIAKGLHFALQRFSCVHIRGFCSLLQWIPLQEGITLCAMPSKIEGVYLLKTLLEVGELTILKSSLVKTQEILIDAPDATFLIGKPSHSIQALFPDLAWTLPEPSMLPILNHLQHAKSDPSLNLIYLHPL